MAAREGTLFKGKIILRRASKCFYGSLYSCPKRSDHPAFSLWIIIIIRCPVERFGDRLLFLDQSHVTAAHSIQPTTIMVLLKCVITIIGAFLIDSDVDPVAFALAAAVKPELVCRTDRQAAGVRRGLGVRHVKYSASAGTRACMACGTSRDIDAACPPPPLNIKEISQIWRIFTPLDSKYILSILLLMNIILLLISLSITKGK